LQGVVAFVDVRTDSDNRSKSIENEVEKLGATVVSHFSKKVTHLIFKDGSKPIYDKAKRAGIPIVSYLWVVACKENGEIVAVTDYPAISSQDYDSPYFKWRKTKSMQPKELDEELKIVERRLDRRRKMILKSSSVEEKSETEFFSPPAIPKSRKSIIDTLIESSPMVQERIHQELAAGKSCQEVFTLKEGEEDDFDTFFDTPLMIKLIAKNYYSPLEPPPKSVRKILSEIATPTQLKSPKSGSNNRSLKKKTSERVKDVKIPKEVTGKHSFGEDYSPITDVLRAGNTIKYYFSPVNSPPLTAGKMLFEDSSSDLNSLGERCSTNEIPRSGNTIKCFFSPVKSPSKSARDVLCIISSPKPSKSKKEKSTEQVSVVEEVSKSGQKRKKRQLAQTEVKKVKCERRESSRTAVKRNECKTEGAEEKTSRKRLLFATKPFFPVELMVPLTPDTPVKSQSHPCFSQTEIRPKAAVKARNQKVRSGAGPELIVPRISPRRDSMADFTFSVIKRRQTADFKELRPAKYIPSLICTSMRSESELTVTEAVRALKCYKLVETLDDSTSHIVCGDSRRTMNVMKGLVRGLKIVSLQWVHDSLREGHWQNEDDYPVERFSARERKRTEKLFAGYDVYVSPKSPIPFRELSDLVERAGGHASTSSKKANLVVGAWKENLPCVTGTWILDCIETGHIVKLDDYLFLSQ